MFSSFFWISRAISRQNGPDESRQSSDNRIFAWSETRKRWFFIMALRSASRGKHCRCSLRDLITYLKLESISGRTVAISAGTKILDVEITLKQLLIVGIRVVL